MEFKVWLIKILSSKTTPTPRVTGICFTHSLYSFHCSVVYNTRIIIPFIKPVTNPTRTTHPNPGMASDLLAASTYDLQGRILVHIVETGGGSRCDSITNRQLTLIIDQGLIQGTLLVIKVRLILRIERQTFTLKETSSS